MPTIPAEARESALNIFNNSSFKAKVEIGKQQQRQGAPLAPGAQQAAVDTLVNDGVLQVSADGKIDIASGQKTS